VRFRAPLQMLQLNIFHIGVKVTYVVPKFDLNGDKMLNYIKLSSRDSIERWQTINVSGGIHPRMYGLLMCKKLQL
jgi:hypothetical protein